MSREGTAYKEMCALADAGKLPVAIPEDDGTVYVNSYTVADWSPLVQGSQEQRGYFSIILAIHTHQCREDPNDD